MNSRELQLEHRDAGLKWHEQVKIYKQMVADRKGQHRRGTNVSQHDSARAQYRIVKAHKNLYDHLTRRLKAAGIATLRHESSMLKLAQIAATQTKERIHREQHGDPAALSFDHYVQVRRELCSYFGGQSAIPDTYRRHALSTIMNTHETKALLSDFHHGRPDMSLQPSSFEYAAWPSVKDQSTISTACAHWWNEALSDPVRSHKTNAQLQDEWMAHRRMLYEASYSAHVASTYENYVHKTQRIAANTVR